MSEMIRAVAYYRMSKHDQENSIERQRSQVIPYAHRQGYRIVAEYTDEGISADEVDIATVAEPFCERRTRHEE